MGFRLFVPPGEGQDELVPKRPTPLGANATLQYAVFSSTGLAAAYTFFARGYAQRVAPHHSISRTALFVRSSARLGLWAGAVGAAVNYYYHSSFTSRIQAQKMPKVKPWRLYKRTKGYTVDDGFLAGAAMGLVSSLPMLLLRRPNIPRWTCTLGLTNIGACTGMLGMHGYLQYTGERQKAYRRLDRRLQRKTSIFWFIFWDKELMAGLNPLWQHYVRHQGIWYNQLLPDDGLGPVTHKPQPTGRGKRSRVDQGEAYADQAEQEESPFYTQPFDYVENLEQIDVASTLAEMDRLEKKRVALLTEAEYLLAVNAVKQYAYCHLEEASEEERKQRLHEIHLIEVTYNHLSSVAHGIESRLAKWQLSLQHKALCDGVNGLEKSDLNNWLPRARTINMPEHRPTIALGEMEQVSKQLSQEIRRFEELCVDMRYTASQRERWRKDLEDGRILLKAADMIAYEFAKALEAQAKRQGGASSVRENAGRQDTVSTSSSSSSQQQQKAEPKSVTAGSEDRKTLEDLPEPQRNRPDDTQRGQEKVDGRPDDRSKMGPNKP